MPEEQAPKPFFGGKELFKALVQFHQNLKQPIKNGKNPFLKNNYVTLEGVQSAVDAACKGTGLTYVQLVRNDDQGKSVTTVVLHESGESLSSGPLTLKPQKNDPQGYGSSITYSKRYQLAAMFGISSELDDDGNKASGVQQQSYQAQQQRSYNNQLYQRNYNNQPYRNNGGNQR